jgi:hypothetical protein
MLLSDWAENLGQDYYSFVLNLPPPTGGILRYHLKYLVQVA